MAVSKYTHTELEVGLTRSNGNPAVAAILYSSQLGPKGNKEGELWYEMNKVLRELGEMVQTHKNKNKDEQQRIDQQEHKVMKFRPLIWWLNNLLTSLPESDLWVYRCAFSRYHIPSVLCHTLKLWNAFTCLCV